MKKKICREFYDWMDRLPRNQLSPAFQDHLQTCRQCREHYDRIHDVAEKISNALPPVPLESSAVDRIAQMAKQTACKLDHRRLAWRLTAVSFLCLPLIIAVNWLWGSAAYTFLSKYVSVDLAHIYLGLFIFTVAGVSGLIYSAVPLLAGWFNGGSPKESNR